MGSRWRGPLPTQTDLRAIISRRGEIQRTRAASQLPAWLQQTPRERKRSRGRLTRNPALAPLPKPIPFLFPRAPPTRVAFPRLPLPGVLSLARDAQLHQDKGNSFVGFFLASPTANMVRRAPVPHTPQLSLLPSPVPFLPPPHLPPSPFLPSCHFSIPSPRARGGGKGAATVPLVLAFPCLPSATARQSPPALFLLSRCSSLPSALRAHPAAVVPLVCR